MKSTTNRDRRPTLRFQLIKGGSLIVMSLVTITMIVQSYLLHEQIVNYQEIIVKKLDSIFELHKSELLDEIALNDKYSLREHLSILRKENSLSSIRVKAASVDMIDEDPGLDHTQNAIQWLFRFKTSYTRHLTTTFGSIDITIQADLMDDAIHPILKA